jgi:RNA polymerase sigma-70 factor, ECF subfamily
MVSTNLRGTRDSEPVDRAEKRQDDEAEPQAIQKRLDRGSGQWVERLRPGHPRREQTVASLHELLRRVALAELSRRRDQLGVIRGPEFESLADQAADGALATILRRLDQFQGRSRFTTWAYKFVILEVAGEVALWRQSPPGRQEAAGERLPASFVSRPGDRRERQELEVLSAAISELTERQRQVFVAVALNDVPMDVLAVQLGTDRNALYQHLFDARRNLRSKMEVAGHPVRRPRAA